MTSIATNTDPVELARQQLTSVGAYLMAPADPNTYLGVDE